ncbi:MAG: hypothetical protein CSYNP_01657 [Syntrophus sp. SKADARSKE-3]|nr:hypothetical protein [Syntrophus sp. SKADARSKE-3]
MAKINNGPVFSIGHSTTPLEKFIEILEVNEIKLVVDVRTIPRSRHNPQFNKETLPGELDKAGIDYRHFPGLGGLHHTKKDSLNTGWRNVSFRGFADYMQTKEFTTALDELIELFKDRRIVIMCAEATPWRCHRSLIADALEVRGFPVEHIIGTSKPHQHKLTSFAVVDGLKITYPEE